jgi:coenzyme F420-reducing hydrogenase delta subunit
LLAFSGIGEDRLRSRWISSAEGPEFAEEIRDFVGALREMGPSPIREVEKRLMAA